MPLRYSGVYPVELSRLRSRGDCRRQSFRSLAAYCSPSAHPRNYCCSAFALSGQKFIRMRAARSAATASHPWRKVATVVIHRKYPIRLIRLILPTGADCGSSVCRLYFLGNAVPHAGEKTSSFSPLTPLSGLSRATPEPLGLSRRIIAGCVHGATAGGTLSVHSRLIARPPLILATVVARLLLLAGKSIFACGLRARTLAVLAPVA